MPKKALVADDSPAIRSMAESLLRQKGYDVLCATNGTEAWELVKMTKPDLVFLDHTLPDLDGEKICEKIKNQDDLKDIPVVVLLGTNEVKKQGKFKDLGADGFVLKPFTPKEFLTQVELFSELRSPAEQRLAEKKEEPRSQTHGYDWFISEMKKEMGEVMPEGSSDVGKDEEESKEVITSDQGKDKQTISQEKGEEFRSKELNTPKKGFDNFIFMQKDGEKEDSITQGMVYSEINFDESTEQKRSEEKTSTIDLKVSDLDIKEITEKLVAQISTKVAEKIAQMIDRKVLEEEIKKSLEEL